MTEIVTLSNLPLEIQEKIPMSLRTFKDVYDLEELPSREKEIIREYLEAIQVINYSIIYDFKPEISKYSDIQIISTVSGTIVEYVKNYLYTLPGDYPFDPEFGCTLKTHLHTRDISLRKVLLNDELNRIINVISSDLGTKVSIIGISTKNINRGDSTEIQLLVSIRIKDRGSFRIELTDSLI